MSDRHRWAGRLLAALLGAGLFAGHTAAQQPSVLTFLDRYAAGDFDAVVADLAGHLDYGELLTQLKRDAPGWIDARGPEFRERRELSAVTLALEFARAEEWHEWKWILRQPALSTTTLAGTEERYEPLNVLYWRAAPLFIEWACERLRKDATPRPIERWWQLAALAVAQRSEDVHFLVGDPNIGRGRDLGEIGNLQDEIKHLDHVSDRFPTEPRFMLAQGIARERAWPDDAIKAFTALQDDPDVGGEATMRLGALEMKQARTDVGLNRALDRFDQVEEQTRDPYVIYLARLFKAQILERQRRKDQAIAAYRDAVAAWPHAQAATISLASLLFDAGRRAEAQALAGAMLAARPPATDPWRGYVHADDRFWPLLVGRLREEIRR